MKLVDTHAHIYLPDFADDQFGLFERAEKDKVIKILMPAIDSGTHGAMMQVEERKPGFCFSMMGLHPCSVKETYKEELNTAAGYLEKRPFIAIGETGLDFYWDKTYTEQQYASFNVQIEWALHYDIPVVIHSRNSIDECIRVVQSHQKGRLKGVFHCFSGSLLQAQQIVDLGLYLGIGGVLTFKNGGLDSIMKEISTDHLILETDSPYLAPVPFRGKRNEPSYLKYVLQKLAGIKETTIEETAMITTTNAEKLFCL